jgi:hypothetical protein
MDMRHVAMTASVVVVAALTIGLTQEKPDSSGTWTMVGESGKRSTTMVVTQTSHLSRVRDLLKGRKPMVLAPDTIQE